MYIIFFKNRLSYSTFYIYWSVWTESEGKISIQHTWYVKGLLIWKLETLKTNGWLARMPSDVHILILTLSPAPTLINAAVKNKLLLN